MDGDEGAMGQGRLTPATGVWQRCTVARADVCTVMKADAVLKAFRARRQTGPSRLQMPLLAVEGTWPAANSERRAADVVVCAVSCNKHGSTDYKCQAWGLADEVVARL